MINIKIYSSVANLRQVNADPPIGNKHYNFFIKIRLQKWRIFIAKIYIKTIVYFNV